MTTGSRLSDDGLSPQANLHKRLWCPLAGTNVNLPDTSVKNDYTGVVRTATLTRLTALRIRLPTFVYEFPTIDGL